MTVLAFLVALGRLVVVAGVCALAFWLHHAALWRPAAVAVVFAGGLLALWSALGGFARRTRERWRLHGRALTDLDAMSGSAFEDWVVASLSQAGFRCENLPRTRDYGIDVIAARGKRRIGVQAKRYDGPVGNGAVQQAIAGAGHHRCEAAAVVTQSRFTAAARAQATSAKLPVVLVARDELGELGRALRRALG